MCFLFTSTLRHITWLIPECERSPVIATERMQYVIIAILNLTTVLHAWGSDFWHIVLLSENKIHCPACLMTVFIVHGVFVSEEFRDSLVETCCAFELPSLMFHQWQEVCGPGLCTSFLSPSSQPAPNVSIICGRHWRRRQAKSSSHVQMHSHLAVSVCQADRGVTLVVAHASILDYECVECNHFAWSASQLLRTPAVVSTLSISLQQPPSPLFFCLIKTHES